MKNKRIAAIATAAVMSATMIPMGAGSMSASAAGGKYNYVEALQKSMFFYEVQQSGVLPEWNQVPWRADSMVDESGKDTDFVPGGWFDAGDHFKFTLTNAYAASLMAWGYLQYEDAVKKAGLDEMMRRNIEFGLDYVAACDQGGGKMVGTIGDFTGGSTDHNIWCSAEVYLRKHHLNNGDWERPYDIISNASVAGISAAALAQGYLMFKDINPTKAADYLSHAKDLFKGANSIKDNKDIGGMSGMYNTSSWLDDCMYAANWLYIATGDQSYLDICEKEYIPNFPLENQSNDRKYTWGMCWDDTTQAAALLYAINTGDEEWIKHVSRHIGYWMNEDSSKKFEGSITPKGLSWLTNWGCLRHATTTAWIAKLACDTVLKDDSALVSKYNAWADSQMNYCFGDNESGLSFVLGMGDEYPEVLHHRTASGIHDDHWNELGQESGGNEGWQTEYAHVLYGALIGGPDSTGNYGSYKVADFQYTEVAIDYNAGYTAALCAMIDEYGGEMLTDFPQPETPKWAEWKIGAVLNGSGDSYTEIKAWAMNHTAWPARVQKDIRYNYYFNVSELLDAGLSVDQIKVEAKSQQYSAGQQGFATVSGPHLYEGDPSGMTYYAEVKFEDGRAIQPTGQSEHRDEVQFRVSIPDAIDGKPTKGAWDPSNDWSYEGVEATKDLKSEASYNQHFTMYVNDILVWGEEPDGTKPTKSDAEVKPSQGSTTTSTTTTTTTFTTTTTTSTTTSSSSSSSSSSSGSAGGSENIYYGDADCNKTIDISDVILTSRIATEDTSATITAQGKLNADCDGTPGISASDAVLIIKVVAMLISQSDLGK
ncbi:MAG: glycoside hydrolase family 9 protein [Oscillospiraceae bacterium]|nr:glycoside hydrolase family 9 protein [Oscillospiraceae bacterium]